MRILKRPLVQRFPKYCQGDTVKVPIHFRVSCGNGWETMSLFSCRINRVCNSHSCLQIILPRRRTIILRCIFPNRPACAAKALLKHFSCKYPPAEPVALRLLAPQRGLFATVRSKSKNKSKSSIILLPARASTRADLKANSRKCQTATATPPEAGDLLTL